MYEKIIQMSKQDYSYSEIAIEFNTTRSTIAGIIWRYKNPGMWKKNIKSGEKRKWYKGKYNG